MALSISGLESIANMAGHIRNKPSPISRRNFLGYAGLGTLLAACGGNGITPPPDEDKDIIPPQGAWTINPNEPFAGEPIQFTASFTDDKTPAAQLRYLWDFGDGAASPENTPNHTYQNAGNYSVTLRVTDQANNTATVPNNVSVGRLANVTFNLRDIIGSLDTEPLVATQGTLVLQKDGLEQRITVDNGTKQVPLKPGQYKVKYENPNYHGPWALMRQQSSDVNISQSDITNEWMTLNVGLEDKVLDLYKIPNSFPLVGFFDLVFDDRHEPGIGYWKPNLPLNVYIDTRAAQGSGRIPSQEWINAIKQAVEALKQIKAIGGRQVFRDNDIIVEVTDNPPFRGAYGTVVAYANDDSPFSGGNATLRDGDGYVTSGAFFGNTGTTEMKGHLHELAQIVADATSRDGLSDTIYSSDRGISSNFTWKDLAANKIVYSFNPGTRFKA